MRIRKEKKSKRTAFLTGNVTARRHLHRFVFLLLDYFILCLFFLCSCHLDEYWEMCIKNEITPATPKEGIAPPGWVPPNERDSVIQ